MVNIVALADVCASSLSTVLWKLEKKKSVCIDSGRYKYCTIQLINAGLCISLIDTSEPK